MRITKTQRELLTLMAQGRRLMWFGDNGPELSGRPFWPQKARAGISPVELTDAGRAAIAETADRV